ncbi:MAG: secretin and TonB N-terminal domain-containing protein, partial [Candidatus Omnitrophica bacterium]|nr:secretin and TonB N-terminal domain-containing protein [Candidatus Omnitrophota bacterium]
MIAAPVSTQITFADEEKVAAPASGAETASQAPAAESAEPVAQADDQSAAQSQPAVTEPEKVIEVAPVEPGNVTVNFKGADIRTVLAYISEVAGVDIVPAPDVKGIVDLRLTNKPWSAALDIIVKNYGFAYEREGDIIRVVTLDKLKQEELATQAFSLNYSKAKSVVDAVTNIVGDRGKVVYDERTNLLLVTDIPTNIYKIAQVVDRLDIKTQQVLIEARIIETVLGDDEKMGIDWSMKMSVSGSSRPTTIPWSPFENTDWRALENVLPFSQTGAPQTTYDAGGQLTETTPADFPATTAGLNPKDFPFAVKSDFTFGTIDFSQFKAIIEFLKSRSSTDTISNPRVATLNNEKATINVGEEVNMPTFERNSTTGKMEITGYEPRETGIILDVTPHINDKNEIALELTPQISDFQGFKPIVPGSDVYAPIFRQRQAKTHVMVKDGDTIFIGGLISDRNVDRRTKIPWLGD